MRKPLLVSLSFLLLATAAWATTVIPMSIERLTHASTHVLLGTAQESWTQWNADHTMIFTLTRFKVSRALKGQAGGEVVVKQMGGRAGAYEQKVAGVRHWQSGDEAMLFVHPSMAGDGTLVVTGLMQGNFSVIASTAGKEKMVSNGVVGVETLDSSNGHVEHFSGAKMPLAQLESLVLEATTREVAK